MLSVRSGLATLARSNYNRRVIYDGHAYCFPDQRGDGGFDHPEKFRRHLQLGMAGHFQPAWRVRDRAPADSEGLIDTSGGPTFGALKRADFRAAGHGRFEWTVDGVDYAKQVIPPSVVDMSYSAADLLAEMDYAGVDMALLNRTPYLGISNEFIADYVAQSPDRIQGLAYVPEWQMQPDPDGSIEILNRAVTDLGLSGLQVHPLYMKLYGQLEEWDGPSLAPFWDGVAALGVPVFFTLGGWTGSWSPTKHEWQRAYVDELSTLRRWMDRYPDVPTVLSHGFYWRMFVDGDRLTIPDEVYEATPLDHPNLSLQIMFPIAIGDIFDYPMPQVRSTLAQLVDRVGPDRLMWGSDIPMVMRYYTYRQSLEFLRGYCDDILNGAEMEMVLGGNTARLMGVQG